MPGHRLLRCWTRPVSYTHLTLPTTREVSITMLAVFFKQKTAYEIMPSLVGSEMCIRDREAHMQSILNEPEPDAWPQIAPLLDQACLLYTSDAADDSRGVDYDARRFFQAEDGIRDHA